jgi:hypothetical protein
MSEEWREWSSSSASAATRRRFPRNKAEPQPYFIDVDRELRGLLLRLHPVNESNIVERV